MTTWDRYILRLGTSSFLVGVGIFSAFLIAGELLRRSLELIMEQGAPVEDALQFFVLRLPNIVTMSLPMAMLLASVIVIGQLSHDNEILALFSSGISFARICSALLFIGVMASLLAFFLRNYLMPQSDRAAERVIRRILGKPAPTSTIVLRQPPYGELRQLAIVQRFEPSKGIMHGIQIIFYDSGQPIGMLSAKQARWEGNGWVFIDGFWQVLYPGKIAIANKFKEMRSQDWQGLPQPPLQKNIEDVRIEAMQLDPDKMTIGELRKKIEHMRRHNVSKLQQLLYLTELHNRFAFAWACFLMALLGAPLGLRTRQAGLGLALGLSILIVLIYYFAWYYGTILARQAKIPILVGCWLPNAISFALGVAMLYRSVR